MNNIYEKLIEAQQLWNKWLSGLPDKPIDEILTLLEAEPEPDEMTQGHRESFLVIIKAKTGEIAAQKQEIERLTAENERLTDLFQQIRTKNPTVEEIVRTFLFENGYDGLYGDFDCICLVDDLFPCGEAHGDCAAGHKVPCPAGGDCDFHIGIKAIVDKALDPKEKL